MDTLDISATPVLQEQIVFVETDFNLSDVAVVKVQSTKIIIASDQTGNKLKSFSWMEDKLCTSVLILDSTPWNLAVMNESKVAVTLPFAKQIVITNVEPELEICSIISTEKGYWGLDVLDKSTFVASSHSQQPSPACVDILDMEGRVLRSLQELPEPLNHFITPNYIHVTREGNILVSDNSWASVICLTRTGSVVFIYRRPGELMPYGITSTSTGGILVVDYSTHKVIHLSESGQFMKCIDVTGPKFAIDFFEDDHERLLYVAYALYGISVYRVPPEA